MQDAWHTFQPFAPWAIAIALAKLVLVLFGKDIKDVAADIVKEAKAVLRVKTNLKALNAFSLIGLLTVVLLFGYLGISVMPPATSRDAFEFAMLEQGARAFYAITFAIALFLCVLLTRHERDN